MKKIIIIWLSFFLLLTGCVKMGEEEVYNGPGIKKGFVVNYLSYQVGLSASRKQFDIDNINIQLYYGLNKASGAIGFIYDYQKSNYLNNSDYDFIGVQFAIMDPEVFRFLKNEPIEDYKTLDNVQYLDFIPAEEFVMSEPFYQFGNNHATYYKLTYSTSLDVKVSKDVFLSDEGICDFVGFFVEYCSEDNMYKMYYNMSEELYYSIEADQITFAQ